MEIIPNSVFGLKKKEYLHLLSSVEDKKKFINDKLYKKASFRGTYTDFMLTQDAIDMTAHYDSILHFFCNIWDNDWTEFDAINDVKFGDVPELTIEIPDDERIWFAHVKPFGESVPYAYRDAYGQFNNGLCISVYLNIVDSIKWNHLFLKYKEITPFFKIILTPNSYYICLGDAYDFNKGVIQMADKQHVSLPRMIDLKSDNPGNVFLNFVATNIVYAVMYCIHSYNHRATIARPKSDANRIYKKHEVHVVQASREGTRAEVTDKLVDLTTYHSAERHAYKGGHHASPIEHDRKGFYRKSRGRGDYDYVNGNFIWVGNKQGKYSYVRSTHVNGVKPVTKSVKVYNVK
jgi:hypothetical protein